MSDDFEPATPARVEQRLVVWRGCGKAVAGYITDEIRRRELLAGVRPSGAVIAFKDNALDLHTLVSAYFREVDAFRDRHEFPDGVLANESKRAAMVIRTLMGVDAHRLFSIPAALDKTDFPGLLSLHLIMQLVCAHLYVDIKNIPEDVEKVLRHCLVCDEPIPDSWGCLATTLLKLCFERHPATAQSQGAAANRQGPNRNKGNCLLAWLRKLFS